MVTSIAVTIRFQCHEALTVMKPPVKGPIEAPPKAHRAYAALYRLRNLGDVNCKVQVWR